MRGCCYDHQSTVVASAAAAAAAAATAAAAAAAAAATAFGPQLTGTWPSALLLPPRMMSMTVTSSVDPSSTPLLQPLQCSLLPVSEDPSSTPCYSHSSACYCRY